MKLSWKDIEPFVKKPDPRARAILVYGPDNGLIKERAKAIGQSVVADLNDPFNVSVLFAATLTEDPARLMDEAMAQSLMGGARLIRIEGAGDALATILRDYLAAPSAHNLVIIEAGELGPKSPLRLLCEKQDNAAAIPCYVDDARGVAGVIRETLATAGYKIDADAQSWLAANIAGDRARVRGELDKLILYMGPDHKIITLDDARAACGEAGDQSLDDLLFALGSGRTEAALLAYTKLLEEGVNTVTIIRSMQNHMRRLHFTKALIKTGLDTDSAMKRLQPQIFFKYTDGFKSQLRKWSEARLLALMTRLNAVEAQMKQTGAPAETLGAQVVLSLAA